MPIINILDQQTANLIAAGEVVDRPAAVAKELLENAIDAGGTNITLEIKNGGSSLIRVTDNGKGMSYEDVKNCVLRHATSKIKTPEDLEAIVTLGFRGEALAAISAVSRFQVISKEPDSAFGTSMAMEGENLISIDEAGCPDGTTITVRDIFFNVPARRKFLKKDATETAYIAQYVERIAISHPDISLKFIADSRVRFSTPGNGDLHDTVYAVYGREFIDSMTDIERNDGKISVKGLISLPEKSRINRSHQIVFVNGRLVRSRNISFAVEDAYKSYIMTDRYPAFILFIDINPHLVDINVHPTKLEVRFVDEGAIRESVYFCVKNKLESRLNPIKEDFVQVQENYEKQIAKNAFAPVEKNDEFKQQEILLPKKEITKPQVTFNECQSEKKSQPLETENGFSFADLFKEAHPIEIAPQKFTFSSEDSAKRIRDEAASYFGKVDLHTDEKTKNTPFESLPKECVTVEEAPTETKATVSEELVSVNNFPKYCGVVFDTYVIAEFGGNMYIIDKHAAHERIIYESMKKNNGESSTQMILDTRVIRLSAPQFECAVDNLDDFTSCGFGVEVFGDNTLALRGVPTDFVSLDISYSETILVEMIEDIMRGKSAKMTKSEIFDKSLHTAACKAATKAGFVDSEESYIWLINKLFECDNVFCCPHGRPVIVKYTKSQIEKMFFRT